MTLDDVTARAIRTAVTGEPLMKHPDPAYSPATDYHTRCPVCHTAVQDRHKPRVEHYARTALTA